MTHAKIPCPQCNSPASPAASNPWRPFCSRRCKMIDLGDWLDESNRIPGASAGASGAHEWGSGENESGSTGH